MFRSLKVVDECLVVEYTDKSRSAVGGYRYREHVRKWLSKRASAVAFRQFLKVAGYPVKASDSFYRPVIVSCDDSGTWITIAVSFTAWDRASFLEGDMESFVQCVRRLAPAMGWKLEG